MSHLAREAGKERAQLQANCRLSQPLPASGTHYLWMAGESLALGSQPEQPGPHGWGQAEGAPGDLCTTLCPERPSLLDLWKKLQELPAPRVFNLACSWGPLPPPLGPEQECAAWGQGS